jgi:hypothetical protein
MTKTPTCDLEEVLRQAVGQYFCHLFTVLMSDPSDKGIARFKIGLTNLAKMEEAVGKIIAEEPLI